MTPSIIDDLDPLEPGFLPATLYHRDAAADALTTAFATETETPQQHVHLSGPRGTGKTHLVSRFLSTFPPTVGTCYLSCIPYDTQYKALERLYQLLAGEVLGTGYHVSDLQRRLTERITLPTVIALDEIDFLLDNDGSDLLYFLSRHEKISLLTISANYESLADQLEARVASSFTPQRIDLDPYAPEQAEQILAERARQALRPRSLHRAALQRIAATTQNMRIGLTWLRLAAETAEDAITPDLVADLEYAAYDEYVGSLLAAFTPHHKRLWETIDLLASEESPPFTTGTIYDEYRDHCATADISPLSERRISDFLTDLELLHLIDVTHLQGGSSGKTREIQLHEWRARDSAETS